MQKGIKNFLKASLPTILIITYGIQILIFGIFCSDLPKSTGQKENLLSRKDR